MPIDASCEASLSAYVEEMPDWVVLSSLGKGSKAEVFLVRDHRGNKFALKKFYPKEMFGPEFSFLFDEEGVRRSAREEWNAGQSLQHPVFIKLFEFDPGKTSYLLMEWVDGQTLLDTPYSSLDPQTTVNLLFDAIQGLQFAFKEGWIHHDMGSDNFMIDQQNRLKFIDLEGFDKLSDDEDVSLEEYRGIIVFFLKNIIDRGAFSDEQRELLATFFQTCGKGIAWDAPINTHSGPIFIAFLERVKDQLLSFSRI